MSHYRSCNLDLGYTYHVPFKLSFSTSQLLLQHTKECIHESWYRPPNVLWPWDAYQHPVAVHVPVPNLFIHYINTSIFLEHFLQCSSTEHSPFLSSLWTKYWLSPDLSCCLQCHSIFLQNLMLSLLPWQKLVFVGGPPPVYPIITVTATVQLLMHRIFFVINLVSTYYLLTQLTVFEEFGNQEQENKGASPIFKMQIDRSHVFYNTQVAQLHLHLLMHSSHT